MKDKVIDGIINEVAEEFNVSADEVEKILNMPYKLMRDHIASLELKGKTVEEVQQMKTNFNMPFLFKLYINTKKVKYFKDKEENGEELLHT